MLKLIPPKAGRPNWYVRGSHVGVRVYRSTTTTDKAAARRILATWRKQIERGEYRERAEIADEPTTFAHAINAYLDVGGEGRFLALPLRELGRTELAKLDQAAIDNAAVRAYPNSSAATRNRCFYTPVSAVMRHLGIKLELRRPKGWRGKRSTLWLEQEQAFAVLAKADEIDTEFGLILRFFLYTGRRLSEVLGIRVGQVNLQLAQIYIGRTKNGDPVLVHLTPDLIVWLANHPRGLDRENETLFRFCNGKRIRKWLTECLGAAGVRASRREGGFHLFRHTWATWMRRTGMDTFDLVRTGAWKDPASAARYVHSETSAAARRADLLPVPNKRSA